MGTIVLSGGEFSKKFPVSTSVAAYERRAKNAQGGAPVGAAIGSAAVAADNTWTLTNAGIVLGGLYTAYALVGSEHRYMDFALSKSDVSLRREPPAGPYGVGLSVLEVTVDLPSIGANAAADVNVALPAGSAKIGDIVAGVFLPALNAGLHVQGAGIVATDSLRVRAQNTTAGALDAAAATMNIAIIRV